MQVRYYSTLKRIRDDSIPPPEWLDDMCGVWYWGVPGSGKSYKARIENPLAYIKMSNKWWDQYNREDTVLIEEIEKDAKYLGHFLKCWTDRYPFRAERKGSTMFIRPKKLIITSNYSIDDIFGEDEVLAAAIKRRFTVTHFPTKFGQLPQAPPLPKRHAVNNFMFVVPQ